MLARLTGKNDIVRADHAPLIMNCTKHSIVVFQDRGTLFNKQVLRPGEAVGISRKQTGGPLPYKVHAVVGDEDSLPDKKQSLRNLASASVVPAAFVAGALATAVAAGTLAGPSLALAPLVNGMVVQGIVIDSAAIGAGSAIAARAAMVGDLLLKKHKDKFMVKTGNFQTGSRYLVVLDGVDDGPLRIDVIKEKNFKSLAVEVIKEPIP